ncbi:MAG TPA: pitrilysin family protein [Bryobacteraceae bacterium]
MKYRFVTVAALLFSALRAQTPAAIPQVAFEKYTLPNGLQVILHVDRKLPVADVNLWFHVGPKNERPGHTGFAHLFEHMMLQGSKNASERYFTMVERAGADIYNGGANGYTYEDHTEYFQTVPSGSLEYALWIESDRLATLPDALTQQKLDNQRDVVKNEKRERQENVPYGRWYPLAIQNLYPAEHPYAHDALGSMEDLSAASLDDVKDFFKTYYSPNNASLAIAGDFDPEAVKPLIAKYFGGIPAGPALDRPAKWVPKLAGEKLIEVKDRVPQDRSYLMWHSPAYFDAGDAALELAGRVLADGLSSRLTKALVYDQQLCSDVSAAQDSGEEASRFYIWATARPGAPLAKIEQVISAEIARLARVAPTVQEVARAENKWEFGFVSNLESVTNKASALNSYNMFFGDPGKFAADVTRHRAVTPEDVRAAVEKWLNNRNRVVLRFRPETSSREVAETLDRSKIPALKEDRPYSPPEVKSAKLDNGMDVLVMERPDLPKVVATLATRAGSVHDPQGKEGLASFTADVMRRGTASRGAVQIEDGLGDLGTALVGDSARERAFLSLEVLKRNLSPAVAILSDVAEHPSFPQAELERERKLRVDQIKQEEADATSLGDRIAPMLVWGREHPYGRPNDGYQSSVQGLSRADLAQFYAATWKPASSALIFAGDITLSEATALAKQYFGGWSGKAAAQPAIPAPHPMAAGKIYLVDRQDAAQTYIVQIVPGAPRRTEEYFAVSLADRIWGGMFGSRLNLNIREEKGYTYGAYSYPNYYSQGGDWRATAAVQTDKTREAVAEFSKELTGLHGERPISEKELADAKVSRVRGYAQQFDALQNVAQQISMLWGWGMLMSELQREVGEVQRVSLEAVNAVAKKYADPGKASILMVGDRGKIGLTNVVLLDAQGNPVKEN